MERVGGGVDRPISGRGKYPMRVIEKMEYYGYLRILLVLVTFFTACDALYYRVIND